MRTIFEKTDETMTHMGNSIAKQSCQRAPPSIAHQFFYR